MKEKSGHKHMLENLTSTKCKCGVELCGSLQPMRPVACNRKKGHKGRCRNTLHPELGIWQKKAGDPILT